MCTWHSFVSINTSHELTAINNVTRNTGIDTFHIITICSWTNMHVTLHMSHCTTTVIYIMISHTSEKKQQTASFNYHATAIYVQITNKLLKYYIYVTYIYLIWAHFNYPCDQKLIYIHFTLVTYASEQICCHTAHLCPTICLLLTAYRPSITVPDMCL